MKAENKYVYVLLIFIIFTTFIVLLLSLKVNVSVYGRLNLFQYESAYNIVLTKNIYFSLQEDSLLYVNYMNKKIYLDKNNNYYNNDDGYIYRIENDYENNSFIMYVQNTNFLFNIISYHKYPIVLIIKNQIK